ncbi:NADP-dependent oxidoreductase domain-containing protein [Mycena capillaripes]|nr:NADP-dependent oxidoreductase domain-containing protein [Mycena capillaripes]
MRRDGNDSNCRTQLELEVDHFLTMLVAAVRLASSGLKVSRIILGCISYGDPEWSGNWVLPEKATKHIKAAPIPTVSEEEVLGRAIKTHNLPRDEIVVMTKLFFSISKSTKESLYGVTKLDNKGHVNHMPSVPLRLLTTSGHRFDPNTLIEETVWMFWLRTQIQALHDVVKAGYIPALTMFKLLIIFNQRNAELRAHERITPFISMQNHDNLLYREEEREMFPKLKNLHHFGVGSIPWSAIAGGALSRPLSQQSKRAETDVMSANFYPKSPANQAIVNRQVLFLVLKVYRLPLG